MFFKLVRSSSAWFCSLNLPYGACSPEAYGPSGLILKLTLRGGLSLINFQAYGLENFNLFPALRGCFHFLNYGSGRRCFKFALRDKSSFFLTQITVREFFTLNLSYGISFGLFFTAYGLWRYFKIRLTGRSHFSCDSEELFILNLYFQDPCQSVTFSWIILIPMNYSQWIFTGLLFLQPRINVFTQFSNRTVEAE